MMLVFAYLVLVLVGVSLYYLALLHPQLLVFLPYVFLLMFLPIALFRTFWEGFFTALLFSFLSSPHYVGKVAVLGYLFWYFAVLSIIHFYRGRSKAKGDLSSSDRDLGNMFYVMDVLEANMRDVKEHGGMLTIAMIDLDNFHEVNRRLGPVQADMLLRLFGKLLLRHLRPADVSTRYGGDEFLVVFPNTSGESAQELLDKIREKARDYEGMFELKGIDDPFGFSAGIVEYSPDYATVREYLRVADSALYEAKKKRGTSVIVKKDKSRAFRNRRYWERIDVGDCELSAVVYDQEGTPHKVFLGNMCVAGVMFFSPVEMKLGDTYELELVFPDGDKLILDARTIWNKQLDNGLHQVGVFLSQLSPSQKFFLHRKIDELKKDAKGTS